MLQFQYPLDPLTGASMGTLGHLVLGGLVQPVCGDAVVGHLFHLAGADLDFDGHAVHAEQGGVQRLVAVGLGNRDVVLESPWQWLVQAVHGAEHAIARIDLVHHDAEGVDIHDLVEGFPLAAHLLVDAVQVLLAAQYVAFQPFALEAVDQRLFDLLDDLVAVAAGAAYGGADALRTHRVHGLEAEILELHAHRVHTEAIGNRCVDFQGFLGDASTLFAGQHFQGAHVV